MPSGKGYGGFNRSAQHVVEAFNRRPVAESLPRPTIQLACYEVQFILRVAAETRTFWEVLSKQTVRVLVRSTLPWAHRIAEEHIDVSSDAEPIVICQLRPSIPCKALQDELRQLVHLPDQRIDDALCVLGVDLHEQHEASLAFDECGDVSRRR